MDQNELQAVLNCRRGASFVTITAITEPDWKPIKAGDNPWRGVVKKRSVVNGVINWQYESAVNRQRLREGLEPDFESKPRAWGHRVHGTPWVEHKDKRYLELKVERVLCVEYVDEDGIVIDSALVIPHIKEPKTSRQGVDKEVILRDYAATNIVAITFGGETHVVAA